MAITPSRLRQNIYKLLDQVAKTGVPIEINRKGRKLKVVVAGKVSKLQNLKKRAVLRGNPEDIVHMDWSGEWKA